MPQLTKEGLQDIHKGKESGPLKFFSLRLEDQKDTPSNPTHIIYVAPATTSHLGIREEYERDVYEGRLPVPNISDYRGVDAGRVDVIKEVVVFYGYSTDLILGDDLLEREETGLFARDEIGEGEVPVEWEVG